MSTEQRAWSREKSQAPNEASIGEKLFRFEDLEVWQRAADLAISLDPIADRLEQLRHYRHAEQLRSAALSISN
jgi:hypothetical protein